MMRGGVRYAPYVLAGAATVLAAIAAPALAQVRMPLHPGPGPFPYAGPGGYRFFWIAGLFALLRVVFVVTLIVLAWKIIGNRTWWTRQDSATQILRERYARGEISDDEYRKRLATLG